jgi:glutaminyl-tRNA synthetase
VPAEVRLFDVLFTKANPMDVPEGGNWRDNVNPNSLEVLTDCRVEPGLAAAAGQTHWPDGIARYQFERLGYFCADRDSTPKRLVFNRTVTLRDTWAKIESKAQ